MLLFSFSPVFPSSVFQNSFQDWQLKEMDQSLFPDTSMHATALMFVFRILLFNNTPLGDKSDPQPTCKSGLDLCEFSINKAEPASIKAQ